MPPNIRQPTIFDIARLLFVGATWGASFLFIALALDGFGPVFIAALRVALAAVVLVAICMVMKQPAPAALSDWRKLALIGLLNSALPFFLIGWGQQFISSAETALLIAITPFCALVFSHFSTRDERVNWARCIGVGVGFCGVLVLVVSELRDAGLGGVREQLAVMLAGACYAGAAVLGRRVAHLPPISSAAVMMVTASVYMLPLAFFFEPLGSTNPGWVPVLSVLFLAIVTTALGVVLRFIIIRDNGTVFMTQVGYLIPLFGVIWSWLFLTASITAQTWTALVLILIGIGITRRGSWQPA